MLKEMKVSADEYEREWLRDYSKIISYSQSDPSKKEEKDINLNFSRIEIPAEENKSILHKEEDVLVSSPDWARSLYRKIAKETHPDKVKELSKKEKLGKIFKSAARSIESGEYNELIDIAIDLDIEVEIPPEIMAEKISLRIKHTRDEIEKIEKSMSWIWGESYGILDIRRGIVQNILRGKSLQEIEKDQIDDIIRDIESF